MEKRTKNKLAALFLGLALLFTISCSYMKTDLGDETIDVSITQIKTSSGDTGVILSFNTVSSNLEIPDIVQGLPVLKLSFAKTTNLSSLYSISIPSSVTEIDTFKGATSITTVILPQKLTSLPLFTGCTKLTNIIIPEKITQIPENCFEGCKALVSVSKPIDNTELAESFKGITIIGKNAFSNCSALKSINLKDSSITILNEQTFYNCTSLKNIKLPETIKTVGSEAFSGCSALDSFIIPGNVQKINNSAFAGTALKELYCYPIEPPEIFKTSLPKMKLEEETQNADNAELQTEESVTEEATESEKEKVYKKVFTLYIPAESESLYKEKWDDLVDWRVIDIKTLPAE